MRQDSNKMISEISHKEYLAEFDSPDKKKREKALEHALDIRKFEIDLYWKRATYFWAFIGATLAGYGALQATSIISSKEDLSVVLCCLGLVFSCGWFCVNKGSKQWQENWENHVDMLEDEVIGPLYKVVLRRPKPKGLKEILAQIINGPSPFSVSKINQIISLYVTILWIFLLYKSLPVFSMSASINWEYVIIIGVTLIICICFFMWGRTYEGGYTHLATKRRAEIDNNA